MLALTDAYSPWIRSCGHNLRPKAWTYPMRILTDYLLIYVSEGKEWITVGDEHYDLEAGAVYLIQPGRLSDKGSLTGSHPYWVHFDLMFHPDRASAPRAPSQQSYVSASDQHFMQADTIAVFGHDFPLLMPNALLPLFHQEIPRICNEHISHRMSDRLRAQQRLNDLILHCFDYCSAQEQNLQGDAQIAHAESAARSSLESDFGVAAFAAAAGLSPSRFHDRYKQLRGITPLRFLTNIRMELARKLLANPTLSISSIASMVGHPDPTVFGRIFRREHGKSPRAYRAGLDTDK